MQFEVTIDQYSTEVNREVYLVEALNVLSAIDKVISDLGVRTTQIKSVTAKLTRVTVIE